MFLLNKNFVLKKLTSSMKSYSGKNFTGRTMVFHRSLGSKRRYRFIDFFRKVRNVPGKVRQLMYDPNRSSHIALVCFKNSVLTYSLAADNLRVGDIFLNSFNLFDYKLNNGAYLSQYAVGSFIFNLENFPKFGGKFFRSAGTYGQILKRLSSEYVLVRMRSREMRLFHSHCFATLGIVSNRFRKFEKLYKAGQNIFRGFRPVVRGEAKNPIDHPHGGNTSGGRPQMSPWGKLTLGVRTRKRSKKDAFYIFKSRHFQK